MELEHGEQTGLVTRKQIAQRAGVKRPAVSNWARRHRDFPAPQRSGDTELFHEAEVARWLANRVIPARQLRDGESAGTTYADRFSRTGSNRNGFGRAASEVRERRTTAADEMAVATLMGDLADKVRGPAPTADYVHLCLAVLSMRHTASAQWRGVEKVMAAGHSTRDVRGLLRHIGGLTQEALRRSGDRTDMRSSLLRLQPRSWGDLTTAVRTAAGAGPDAFPLLLESFNSREGLQSTEFCSPTGLASLAAKLVLTPGRQATVLDTYMRGGEMLAAAHELMGDACGPVYGETLDGRLQAVASLRLLHLGVQPVLTSIRSDKWPPDRTHRVADVVLSNPPFNMSDAAGPGLRTRGTWPYGQPPRGNDNFAWLQYDLDALKPGGRAVVIMPVKAGNSVHPAEQEIRRNLARRAVECVITLPSHLFSGTPVPVSLWVLRCTERPEREEILFVDAQGLGVKAGRRRVLRDADTDAIVALVRPWLEGKELPAQESGPALPAIAVARADVADEESSLRPADHLGGGKYGTAPEAARLNEVGAEAVRQRDVLLSLEQRAAEQGSGYRPSAGPTGWKEARLADLCKIQAGPSYTRLPARERSEDGEVPLVFPQDLSGGKITDEPRIRIPRDKAEPFAKFRLLPDDIVCVRTGAQQQPALVSGEQSGWLLSSNVTRLRVRQDASIDPLYLHAYLGLQYAREWMSHRAAATAAPSLNSAALGHLPVRLPPIEQQRRYVELLGDLGRRVEECAAYASSLGQLRTELSEHLLHGLVEPL
ncbi:N-6 DNA methylase [Streptomyces cremeus]|uniref:N-6 DNA methylase n=1 Tax=Streptomyces cremeus TaxID=66881 RepID=A0ABV5P8U1_STRCM